MNTDFLQNTLFILETNYLFEINTPVFSDSKNRNTERVIYFIILYVLNSEPDESVSMAPRCSDFSV